MLTQDKTGLLKAFLGSLPGPVATRLAQAVEVDRLMDGAGLPHEEILTGLRPVLRVDGPERTPTPLRLFCLPVQDLLTNTPSAAKQKAVIARAHVIPVWSWLSHTVMPQAVRRYAAEIRNLILTHNAEAVMARAHAFHAEAAQAIAALLNDPVEVQAARTALGGEAALADAREIALLLAVAPQIAQVQAILPAPVPTLTEALVWELRAVYDMLIQNHAEAAPYVAVIAMNRLARPWEALRLPINITRQAQDTLLAKTDMGLVGEILFARMERQQSAILATRHPLFEAAALLEEVSSFALLSSAIVKEVELRRDGEWGKRILSDRAAVGRVMDGFMERAPREIAAAMPMQRGPGKAADFSRAIGDEKKALALNYARLVVGSRNFAAAASFASKQKDAFEEAGGHLHSYMEDVVKEMRVAEPERRAIAESQFRFCIDLTAILFSAEEAELLRRRGKAAQAAA